MVHFEELLFCDGNNIYVMYDSKRFQLSQKNPLTS